MEIFTNAGMIWSILSVFPNILLTSVRDKKGRVQLVLAKSQSHNPRLFKILADAGYDKDYEILTDTFNSHSALQKSSANKA